MVIIWSCGVLVRVVVVAHLEGAINIFSDWKNSGDGVGPGDGRGSDVSE